MMLTLSSESAVKRIIYGATAIICLAIMVLNQKWIPHPTPIPSFVYKLPGLNALLNGSCSILLIISYAAIRQKKIDLHKRLNITAFILSSLFLISYVTAHFFIPDTRYGDINHDGILSPDESSAVRSVKPVYLVILLTHILLAVAVLPMVLLSFYYGLTDQRQRHRKLTRFSFPIWLYVTITGVVVYLMISPYYNF
jgi:putative membrane protein